MRGASWVVVSVRRGVDKKEAGRSMVGCTET